MDLKIQQVGCKNIPYEGCFERTELAVRGEFTKRSQELLQGFFGLLFSHEKEVPVKCQVPDLFERVLLPVNHIFERAFFQVDSAGLFAEEDLTTFGPNGKEQEIN